MVVISVPRGGPRCRGGAGRGPAPPLHQDHQDHPRHQAPGHRPPPAVGGARKQVRKQCILYLHIYFFIYIAIYIFIYILYIFLHVAIIYM